MGLWGGLALTTALACPAPAGWEAEGRLGCEVEATQEEFGSGVLWDARADGVILEGPDLDPAESILARRYVDRSTQWSVLGDLVVDRSGRRSLRTHGRLQVGRSRTRGDLEVQSDGPVGWGRLSAGGRFLFQAGPEGKYGGRSLSLRSVWASPRSASGWETRLIAAGERSWGGADSLAGLFEYARWLPSIEVRRLMGGAGELALRGGGSGKVAYRSKTADYRERWAEGEWSWFDLGGAAAALRTRTEVRTYPFAPAGLPSYEDASLEGETEFPLRPGWRWRLAPSLARSAYASDDSLVFRDHWSAEVTTRIERAWRAGGDHADLLAPATTLHLGLRQAWLRNERAHEADFASTSVLFGGGRDASARWWLDLSGEYGRRDYRGSGSGGTLVYEGYNLTVGGTDFTFVSGSLLAQASWRYGLRLELFGLFERELHRDAADDFTLWSWSAALTRAF